MPTEKEVKNTKIEIRLTPTEKQQIRDYAAKHGLSMSEAVLGLCQRVFAIESEEE